MSTVPHPAHMFTEGQASAFNAGIKAVLDARLKRQQQAAAKPRKREPIVYSNWFDAETALDRFEMIDDPQKKLDEVHDDLNTQYLLEEELCRILASNPTDQEKMKILGYEQKRRPSLPGILDTTFHIDGSLEKCRARIADLEKRVPRLKVVVEEYLHVKESFKAWPRFVINRLKTESLDRQLIAGGKLPQGSHRKNIQSARSVEFVPL
jgi:hypothetical protein